MYLTALALMRYPLVASVLCGSWCVLQTASDGGDTVDCQPYFPQKTQCPLWLAEQAHGCVSGLGRADRLGICMADCPLHAPSLGARMGLATGLLVVGQHNVQTTKRRVDALYSSCSRITAQ